MPPTRHNELTRILARIDQLEAQGDKLTMEPSDDGLRQRLVTVRKQLEQARLATEKESKAGDG